MGRLFWKIFLWFWLATILTIIGVTFGVAQYLRATEADRFEEPRRRLAALQVGAVAQVLEHGGVDAAAAMLRDLARQSRLRIFAFDPTGSELLGRGRYTPGEAENSEQAAPLLIREARAPDGRMFRIEAESRVVLPPPVGLLGRLGPRPGPPFPRDPWLFVLRLAIALAISAAVCFWLAWYLTRPVMQLRSASRMLASGDLSVRAAHLIGHRRDEIADLGQDFDRVVDHLRSLLASHKQLLSDVSHELRSPLARLQLALGLARQKGAGQVAAELNRIELEADRLNALIGELLALASLESGGRERHPRIRVDLVSMLEDVVEDAGFEASERNCSVTLAATAGAWVEASEELLRRAVENVVRNAVRYARPGTEVEVRERDDGSDWVVISICDRGPGVPEADLSRLFQPFVRVDSSRTRSSGGHGLGLAIAERAVQLHGGEIGARNRDGGGLCVQIRLPRPSA